MFQIPGFEPFMTTVGKLNFFRWAIETQLLDYIEENYEKIQKERVDSMRPITAAKRRTAGTAETVTDDSPVQQQIPTVTATAGTTAKPNPDSSRLKTTRRRRSKQIPAATRQMQKHDIEVSVSFD